MIGVSNKATVYNSTTRKMRYKRDTTLNRVTIVHNPHSRNEFISDD